MKLFGRLVYLLYGVVDFFFGLVASHGRLTRDKLERIKSQVRTIYEGLHKIRTGKLKVQVMRGKGYGISHDKCLQSWCAPTCKNVVSICGFSFVLVTLFF